MDLILASTSRYRRTLLERLGVPFRCEAPRCDEDALKPGGPRDPVALAAYLAEAKAASVAGAFPDAIVIGSDQLVALDQDVLGKPGDATGATAQLTRMSGREHRLVTALVVISKGQCHRHNDITTLAMRRLDAAAIARYIAADQPFDCAGSYKLECRGIALFERIDSADHSAITGLPLIALTTRLRALGVPIP
ncbi:MAG: septum formation protein Maf [Planctomycetes bacterium]|nr:septum formation protein Maf [Planctomycetota bacterium]